MSALGSVTRAAAGSLEPLAQALSDRRACQRLLRQLGREVPLSDESFERFRDVVGLSEILADLDLDAPLPALVAVTTQAADRIRELAALEAADLEGLPGSLARPETWTDLSSALPDVLLARWLAENVPAVHAVLRLTGVCVIESDGRTARERFRWDALGPALADPAAAVREVVGWDGAFASWPLQRELGLALARVGLPVRVRPRGRAVAEALAGGPVEELYGVETDVVLFSGITPGGQAELGVVFACTDGDGGALYVGNLAYGELTGELELADGWQVEAAGSIDGTATIGVRVRPSGVELVGGDAALAASVALVGDFRPPAILLGEPGGTRIEVDGVRVELGVSGSSAAPEAYVLAAIPDGGFRFILDLGPADAFLRGVIGGAPEVAVGGTLRWGTRSGLAFSAGVGLTIGVPLDVDAGLLHVDSLMLELGASGDGGRMAATLIAGLSLGPIAATVEGIGAALALAPGDGLGGLAAELDFLPPTAVAISVDAEGIVTGGGLLRFEPGRYSGLAQLDMLGVGLTVMGIVETELPGDPDGWSLFLSVIADFSPVPLGFGFTLSGIGGFMGLHRALDDVALAEGVKEGRLDSLLFPEDPLAEVDRILADVEAYFPTRPDQHTFGAMARIGWGSPTLIDVELGVVLTVPDVKVAVIGELATVLPNEDERLLELHMGVLGVIDVAEGTLSVTASIYDSQLVGMALSGDMAAYLAVTGSPYFLLSVGGFHPGWDPPALVPSSMRDLRRMSATIDLGDPLRIDLDCYFAITSNTLQFGAELLASAHVRTLGIDFAAEGWFAFDVLLTFTPFSLRADMTAGVTVRAEGTTLFGVQLDLHAEGPDPWYGSGYAEFRCLGFEIEFRVEVGGHAAAELPSTIPLWPLLEAALLDDESWSAAAGGDSAVTLRSLDPVAESGLWLAPADSLEVRQRVLPLNRRLEAYGEQRPEGEDRFDVESAGLATGVEADWDVVEDDFAPAQFTVMTTSERLSAPSFERMDAGVTLAGAGHAVPTAAADVASVEVAYDEYVIEDDPDPQPVVKVLTAERLGVGPALSGARPAAGPAGRFSVTGTRLVVEPARYQVVEPLGALRMRTTDGGRFSDAIVRRRATAARAGGRPRVVPAHDVRVGVVDIDIDFDFDFDLDPLPAREPA